MITVVECSLSKADWNSTASEFQDFSLIQLWDYGEAKESAGTGTVVRLLFQKQGATVGLCQCVVRKIPFLKGGVVWVNRGPLWRKGDGAETSLLLEMLGVLKRYWVDERGFFLLVAPPISRAEIDEGRLKERGFTLSPRANDWASARLDLEWPLDKLRGNLEHKWRNGLSKAERSGLQCVSGTDEGTLSYILFEYAQLIRDKNLKGSASPEFLAALQSRLPPEKKMWGFIAVKDNQKLGGILIARYGSNCEYLVGAVNNKIKSSNAGNFLLWQAVSRMKDLKCRWFDVGGMHPVDTPAGIFHFKEGLGGKAYGLMGNIEASNGGLLNRVIRWRLHHG